MISTAKQLRFKTKELLDAIALGEKITITHRGKPCARLIPIENNDATINQEDELFGIWSDNDNIKNVNQYVRNLRKGRTHDN